MQPPFFITVRFALTLILPGYIMEQNEKGCGIMKNRKILVAVVLLVLVAGLAGIWYFNQNYILLGGSVYARETAELDLSGSADVKLEKLMEMTQLKKLDLRDTRISSGEYEQLHAALPDCDIHWSVPFQSGYQDSRSQSLTVSAITDEDIAQLTYFAELQAVDATGCGDIGAVAALMEAYPELAVSYLVSLNGASYPHDTTELTLTDVDGAELSSALAYLPAAQQVELEGILPEGAQLQALREDYPNVDFHWEYELLGVAADSDTTELTLTDVPAETITALQTELLYLPGLEKVNLEGELADAAALQELTAAFPEIKFYWQIELFGVPADVDTVELDLSDIKMESVDTVENALGYLPSLEKVIMCNCGISNEDMDALWKRNPEVRFVWSVQVGAFTLRTDETAFMPGKYRKLPQGNQIYNLRYCVDMEALDLGHCNISDCEFVAYMPNLKYLLLPLTKISDISPLANHDKLVYLELFTCRKLTDYTPLLTLTNLEDLNICYTYGDIEIISQMTWLKNLWWSAGKSNKAITQERYEILSKALPNTYLELDTQSSTAEGWRQLPHYYEQRDIFEMPYFTA